MRRWWVLALLVSSPACVGLAGDSCDASALRALGFAAGADGVPHASGFGAGKRCVGRNGAAPDLAAYSEGWRQGRATYCTPERGFAEGARGAAYAGVCDDDAADTFLAAYGRGRRLFDLQTSANRAADAMSAAQTGLWETRRRVAEIETALVSSASTHEERVELVAELKSLKEERRKTEAMLPALADRKADAEAELAAFQTVLASEESAPAGALRPANASF